MQNPDVLTETHTANTDKTVHKTVQELHQTVDPHTELQESMHEEQEDERRDQPEEEEDSVKGTVLKNCPTIDPHYVLHSQNPAECASVNTLAGLNNGIPQRGLLQNKHKIRVDFKVSFCWVSFFILPLGIYEIDWINDENCSEALKKNTV